MSGIWEEIHGFDSPGEFKRFCTHVDGQVSSGLAVVRTADPSYEKGKIFGGRWFENVEAQEIWRLVAPDFPFRGLWEKVEQNDH
jgi:hypothetical protein